MTHRTQPVIKCAAFVALLVLVFFAAVGARTLFAPVADPAPPTQIKNARSVNGCISMEIASNSNNSMLMACPAGSGSTTAPVIKLFDCGSAACSAPLPSRSPNLI